MKDEEEDRSSLPFAPSPPSPPLPISTGPGNEEYFLSRSPSPSSSPLLTPPSSARTSTENLRMVKGRNFSSKRASSPSSFSVDQILSTCESSESSSCLKELELLEWFVLGCCSCCSWINLNPPTKLHQS